jgi:hypothetical protein
LEHESCKKQDDDRSQCAVTHHGVFLANQGARIHLDITPLGDRQVENLPFLCGMNGIFPNDQGQARPSENPHESDARLIRMVPRADMRQEQPPDAAIFGLEALRELDRMLDAHFE